MCIIYTVVFSLFNINKLALLPLHGLYFYKLCPVPIHISVDWSSQAGSIYCWEGVFTAPLRSNGSYSIAACVFIAARMCLPSRCIAINVCSHFSGVISQYIEKIKSVWECAMSMFLLSFRRSEDSPVLFPSSCCELVLDEPVGWANGKSGFFALCRLLCDSKFERPF
jgi:hypothetical protein